MKANTPVRAQVECKLLDMYWSGKFCAKKPPAFTVAAEVPDIMSECITTVSHPLPIS
jgi:hypothetical protein